MSVPRIFEQLTEKLGWTIERFNNELYSTWIMLEIYDRRYSTTIKIASDLEHSMRTFGITKEFRIPIKYDIGGCGSDAIRTRLQTIEAWDLIRLGRKQPNPEGALHFKWVERTPEWTSLNAGGFIFVEEEGVTQCDGSQSSSC